MVFGEGRGDRGRAGAAPVPARAPSVTPRLLKKVPLRANVSGAFGKMTFEASDGRGDLHGATEHGPVRVDIRETHL